MEKRGNTRASARPAIDVAVAFRDRFEARFKGLKCKLAFTHATHDDPSDTVVGFQVTFKNSETGLYGWKFEPDNASTPETEAKIAQLMIDEWIEQQSSHAALA